MDSIRLPGPITGEELMRRCSGWPPERFEAYCRMLVHAEAGRPAQPGARPGRADRGIDAEVITPADYPEKKGLVGPGRNLYQFKRVGWGRDNALSWLKASLRRDFAKLVSGGPFDRFVALTNWNLGREARGQLEEALRNGDGADSVREILVFGAEVLSEYTNARPQVLFAYFPEVPGLVWHAEFEDAYERSTAPADIERKLTGREVETSQIQAALENPEVRGVVVQGRSGVGKTRLVLEALEERAPFTLWSPAPAPVPVDLLRRLDASSSPTYVVVDDVDAEQVRGLLDMALARQRTKLIVIPRGSGIGIPPSRERRVVDIALAPLREGDIVRMVREALGGRTAASVVDEIARKSGGLPGVAIELVLVEKAGGSRANLLKDLRARLDLEEQDVQRLGALSVLTHLRADPSPSSDVHVLAEVFQVPEPALRSTLQLALLKGHVIERGRYVSVIPGVLAQLLAEECLRCHPDKLELLLLTLPESSLPQLFERLGGSDVARDIWREVLGAAGPFSDPASLRQSSFVLEELARFLPRETLRCIRRVLDRPDGQRGSAGVLPWTLIQIALQGDHFESAVSVLSDLVGDDRNDEALQALHRLFHVENHGAGPGLARKAEVLSRLSERRSQVAAEIAAGAASDRTLAGFLPVTRRGLPPIEEMRLFGRAALAALEANLPHVPRTGDGFSWTVEEIARAFGCLDEAFNLLDRLSIRPDLAPLATDLRQAVQEALADYPMSEDDRVRWEGLRARLESNGDDLDARLRRMLGPRTHSEIREAWDRCGGLQAAEDGLREELHGLATRVAKDPAAVRDETWRTVFDGSLFRRPRQPLDNAVWSRVPSFFRELGRAEAPSPKLALRMMCELERECTWRFLGPYVAGVLEGNRAEGDRLLAELLDAGSREAAQAYLGAVSAHLEHDGWGGLAKLVDRELLSREEAASAWSLRKLPAQELLVVLQMLDDGSPAAALALLDPLRGRADLGSPELARLTQGLVERGLLAQPKTADWQCLAASLAEHDPAWGLHVLAAAARTLGGLDLRHSAGLLWDACAERDRGAAVKAVLNGSLDSYRQTDERPYGGSYSWITASQDGETLVAFAQEQGPEGAEVAAALLNAEDKAFFSIAVRLVDMQPADERLRSVLTSATGSAVARGSFVPVYEGRIERARRALQDGPKSGAAREWLEDTIARYEGATQAERLHDQEADIHRLRRCVRGGDPGLRRWAMGRIIHSHPERIGQWLTQEQIEKDLPFLDLDDRERRAVEAMVASWRRNA